MKILITRFSSIGDIVLTSPVVRCLRNNLDNLELHYLTKDKFRYLLDSNPHLDKVYTFDRNINEVINSLLSENYDLVIDLHNNLRTLILKYKLGVKSYSFKKLNFKKWLLINFNLDLMPNIHLVDRYMDTLKHLEILNDLEGLDYFLNLEDESIFQNSFPYNKNSYIALVIGGNYEGKKLPPQSILELCKNVDQRIILLGDNNDRNTVEQYEEQFKINNVYNACGEFTLNESAIIIKHASIVITNDTGLMHIASAFKKKIISLWGCTSPKLGMYPYFPDSKSVIIEPDHIKLRPCSKLGNRCKYGQAVCAKEISVFKIIEAVNDLV